MLYRTLRHEGRDCLADLVGGELSGRKCRPFTVTSVWFGQPRQTSRWRPTRIEPGSALMKSFGRSDAASQAE